MSELEYHHSLKHSSSAVIRSKNLDQQQQQQQQQKNMITTMIKTKPEHTPAPTPGRAVYGFCLFLLVSTLFIIYVFWAFLPTSFLEGTLGLNYLPDKYFALYLPILILCATTIFAFFIYPSLSLSMTPDIDDECTIRDQFTIYRCQFIDTDGQKCDKKATTQFENGWSVHEYCEYHDGYLNNRLNGIVEDESITNMCDCPTGQYCLLNENPDHVKNLRNRQKVPTICDLDLAEICNNMFDN